MKHQHPRHKGERLSALQKLDKRLRDRKVAGAKSPCQIKAAMKIGAP